jgi:hypothetical protein
MFVAKCAQFSISGFPIDLLFFIGKFARIADQRAVKSNSLFF